MLDFISENVAGLAGAIDQWSVTQALRYLNEVTNPRRLWIKYWSQYCNQSERVEQPKTPDSTPYLPQIIALVYFLTVVAAIVIYKWRHRSKLYEYFPDENTASITSHNSLDASFEVDLLNKLRHLKSLSSRLLDSSSSSHSFIPSEILKVFTRGPIPETLELLFSDRLGEQKSGVEVLLSNERFVRDLETSLNGVLLTLRTRLNGPFSNGRHTDVEDKAIQMDSENVANAQQSGSEVEKDPIEIGTGDFGSLNQHQMEQELVVTPDDYQNGAADNQVSESLKTKPKVTECKSSAKGSTLNIQIDFDRKIRLGYGA